MVEHLTFNQVLFKERPIIISTSLIPATLDGRKTQTRRVIKPQPVINEIKDKWVFSCKHGVHWWWLDDKPDVSFLKQFCPYGQVGDRLWVKETWDDGTGIVLYKADCTPLEAKEYGFGWQSPLFMFRQDSRITLEITGVRVARLQEISESNIISEGSPEFVGVYLIDDLEASRRYWFKNLWNSLNAKYSWETNPWIWCISFKKIDDFQLETSNPNISQFTPKEGYHNENSGGDSVVRD